ncbi:MAG: hypothetical protein MN733_13610 [Nitrososphaera sp.]|nr:hypothetical protein [Nitrososphaera sp.]
MLESETAGTRVSAESGGDFPSSGAGRPRANHEIGIFQPDEVWLLRIQPGAEDKDEWIVDKFKVARSKYQDYNSEEDDPPVQFRRPEAEVELDVVSRLNEKEEVVFVSSSAGSATAAATSTTSSDSITNLPETFSLGDDKEKDKKSASVGADLPDKEKKKDQPVNPRS